MRFRDDQLTLGSALPRLLVDQHDLTSSDARSILRSLDRVRISPNPTQALMLDVVSVEVNVVAWGEIRIQTYLEDDRPGWRDLAAALKRAMHLSKTDVDQLRFDPREVEQ